MTDIQLGLAFERALASIYVVIAFVALHERNWWLALYWTSAFGITLAVRGLGTR